MWLLNTAISVYTAADTGNWAGLAGGIIGGSIGGAIGKSFAYHMSGMMTRTFAESFIGGAITGAVEFGAAGFGAGFGGGLAGGASFSDAVRMGGIGAAIGAGYGAIIQGSYMAGWQEGMHGLDKETVLSAARDSPAISKNPFELREEMNPRGNWVKKWVPEGPLSVDYGKWQFRKVMSGGGLLSKFGGKPHQVGQFRRPVTFTQKGHWEFLGGYIKRPSISRTWNAYQVGEGPIIYGRFSPDGVSTLSISQFKQSEIKPTESVYDLL